MPPNRWHFCRLSFSLIQYTSIGYFIPASLLNLVKYTFRVASDLNFVKYTFQSASDLKVVQNQIPEYGLASDLNLVSNTIISASDLNSVTKMILSASDLKDVLYTFWAFTVNAPKSRSKIVQYVFIFENLGFMFPTVFSFGLVIVFRSGLIS